VALAGLAGNNDDIQVAQNLRADTGSGVPGQFCNSGEGQRGEHSGKGINYDCSLKGGHYYDCSLKGGHQD